MQKRIWYTVEKTACETFCLTTRQLLKLRLNKKLLKLQTPLVGEKAWIAVRSANGRLLFHCLIMTTRLTSLIESKILVHTYRQ